MIKTSAEWQARLTKLKSYVSRRPYGIFTLSMLLHVDDGAEMRGIGQQFKSAVRKSLFDTEVYTVKHVERSKNPDRYEKKMRDGYILSERSYVSLQEATIDEIFFELCRRGKIYLDHELAKNNS